MTGQQSSLDARLRMLEQILGETCRLSDEIPEEQEDVLQTLPIPDIRPLPEARLTSTNTTVADTCLRFTHCSVGDRAPENTTFCTWNSVTSYPDLFIGKTNRPIVTYPKQTKVGQSVDALHRRGLSSTTLPTVVIGTCKLSDIGP